MVLVTKSGSDQFHGSAFEFFRNNKLNANSFFFNSTGQPRPVLSQNQFAGTLGGPIRRNKTFFFLSYQGTRQRNGLSGSTSLQLPPIPLDRSPLSLGKVFGGQKGARGTLTVAPDGSNISPVALAVLNFKFTNGDFVIPSPQTANPGVNYAASRPATFVEDQGISIGMQRFNSSEYPDIPSIAVTGAFTIGYDVNGDQGVHPTTWTYADTLSWVVRSHQIRGGVEARRYDDNYYSRNRCRGSLAIQTFPDFLLGKSGAALNAGGNGSGFSNINTASVASGIPDGADRITDLALFISYRTIGR
ncbi:MAG: hypothetical protein M3Y27_00545 [Acidobacteriota bacterium]|nr:hypothetical protein [Acidobacteriota bacterium]